MNHLLKVVAYPPTYLLSRETTGWMQHYAISKLRYVSSDAVCSVVHMVAYKTLKHWKTQIKPSSKKGGRGR